MKAISIFLALSIFTFIRNEITRCLILFLLYHVYPFEAKLKRCDFFLLLTVSDLDFSSYFKLTDNSSV